MNEAVVEAVVEVWVVAGKVDALPMDEVWAIFICTMAMPAWHLTSVTNYRVMVAQREGMCGVTCLNWH